MSGSTNKNGRHVRFCAKLKPAFVVLLEAFEYAEDTQTGEWDFAVSIRQLEELGLNENDLRWLLRKGYVEHARDMTVPGTIGREFSPTGDLIFCNRTCFVLTQVGVAKARSVAEDRASIDDQPRACERSGHASNVSTPHWDADARELRVHGDVVKRFKWHAANQEVVLSAFEEEGWPVRIDDPLPPHPEQDSKRRLSDTIKCLNRKQTNELLHFRGDGTGEGIVWECVTQHDPNGRR